MFASAATLTSARTLVHAGALIDGVAASPQKQMTIVIDGDRIVAVQPGYTSAGAGDKIIDLTTDEVIALMKQHGTYYVPTLSAGRWVLDKARIPGALPAIVVPKALLVGAAMRGTFQRADQAGVKIAFGTDQGVAPHGDNALEFVYMVEEGMAPMKAICAATIEAAKLIGADKDLGSVEAGKFADLVAVPGDVLRDIKLVTKVSFVMKGGVVYAP